MLSNMANAEKLSIAQLQQVIQNGTLPAYVGIPLLQQKMQMQQHAQQSQPQQQPPVAQQVMAQADQMLHPQQAQQQMPQQAPQGVTGLPSNLPTEGMAQGGIVAFEDGGDVQLDPYGRYYPMGERDLGVAAGLNMGDRNTRFGAEIEGKANKRGIEDRHLNLSASHKTDNGTTYRGSYTPEYDSASLDRISREGNSAGIHFNPNEVGVHGRYNFAQGGEVIHAVNGLPPSQFNDAYTAYSDELNDPNAESSTFQRTLGLSSEAARNYALNKLAELNRMRYMTGKAIPGARGTAGNYNALSPSPGIFTPTTPAEREAYAQREKLLSNFASGLYDPKKLSPAAAAQAQVPPQKAAAAANTTVDPNAQPNPNAPAGDGVGGLSIPNMNFNLKNTLSGMKVPDMPTLDKAGYLGKEETPESVMAQRDKLYGQRGVGTKAYDDVKDKLDARLGDIEPEKKNAIWNALMMGGLGAMAGTSQFALKNIAEGAMPALKGYNEAINKLDDKKDKLEERQFAVADAKNKFLQTGADSDLQTLNARQAERRGAERDFTKFETQTKEHYDDKKYDLEKSVRTADMELQVKTIQLQFQKMGVDTQAFSAKTQRMVAERPDLASEIITSAKSDPKFTKLSGMQKAEYLEKLAASGRGTGANTSTQQSNLQKEFGNPLSPIYKEYKRIEKDKGLDAAEIYRRNWIATEMNKAPAAPANAAFNYDPNKSALIPFTM